MQEYYTFSIVISNIFGKKRNIIVTFQSVQLPEQPKTLEDLGCFDLKMFRNCLIRIEIITDSHIFRIWQHKLCATLSASVNISYRLPIKVYLITGTARGKIFGIKCQPVVKTI
jgi:hypothetical protein